MLDVLRTPARAATLSTTECATLLMQARTAGLVGRLPVVADTTRWPAPAQAHLLAARRAEQAQHVEVRREIEHIRRALLPLGAPVVLLKGAAYVAAGLPCARGRVFSDIDILVPKASLPAAEALLGLAGWVGGAGTAYDESYYRKWMHELPPMEHAQRGTTLDVHHTIVPETARLKPDAARLFEQARPLPGQPGLFVLAPCDMVLHSMTHLFINDDMSRALRDLSDLDLLLRDVATHPGWWTDLVQRAEALDLRRPLYYGLRCAQRLLGTPVPEAARLATARWAPRWPLRPMMDALWRRAVSCPHPEAALPGRALALALLYVRGHWLRMPPLLLARHLTIKALRLHERHTNSPVPR